MSIKWHKWVFWSLALSIPFLAFRAGQKYSPDGHSIAKCEKCRRLIHARALLRLQVHLVDDHKLDLDAALLSIKWICERIGKNSPK